MQGGSHSQWQIIMLFVSLNISTQTEPGKEQTLIRSVMMINFCKPWSLQNWFHTLTAILKMVLNTYLSLLTCTACLKAVSDMFELNKPSTRADFKSKHLSSFLTNVKSNRIARISCLYLMRGFRDY